MIVLLYIGDLSASDIGNNESGRGTVLVQVPMSAAQRERSVSKAQDNPMKEEEDKSSKGNLLGMACRKLLNHKIFDATLTHYCSIFLCFCFRSPRKVQAIGSSLHWLH